ncbi:hypothetical protein [Oceanicoccus sagamiensis]|nr:hypothetical protein [Oceanicoccus sagamiensis]
MINESVKIIDEETLCIEHDIDGIAWRFYYKMVDGQWVRYMRERIEQAA